MATAPNERGPTPARPIGLLEKWSYARHNTRAYLNVTIAADYAYRPPTHDGEQPGDIKALAYAALAQVITELPPLCIVPSDDVSNPTWLTLPCVPLDRVVRFIEWDDTDAERWTERVLEGEHALPFDTADPTLPLWRALVAVHPRGGAFRVFFTFHHAIGDGLSGVVFHTSLLRAINNPTRSADGEHKAVVPASARALAPPLEELMDVRMSAGSLVKMMLVELVLPARLTSWLGWAPTPFFAGFPTGATPTRIQAPAPPEQPHLSLQPSLSPQAAPVEDVPPVRRATRVQLVTLSPAQSAALARSAKSHGVSVHAAIHTALALATSRVFSSFPSLLCPTVRLPIRSGTPVNLRPALRALPECERDMIFGNLVGVIPYEFPVDDMAVTLGAAERAASGSGLPSRFWPLARAYHALLHADMPKTYRQAASAIGPLAWLPSKTARPVTAAGASGQRPAVGWEPYLLDKVRTARDVTHARVQRYPSTTKHRGFFGSITRWIAGLVGKSEDGTVGLGLPGQQRRSTFEISNLGLWDFEAKSQAPAGPWTVTSAIFSQSSGPFANFLQAAVLTAQSSGKEGRETRVCVSTCYEAGSVLQEDGDSEEDEQALMGELKEGLRTTLLEIGAAVD